jgi:putative hemolysin
MGSRQFPRDRDRAAKRRGTGLTALPLCNKVPRCTARDGLPEAIVFELVVILALIALNGVFAMSELAVVSSRRSRLRLLAESGRRGAASALALADDPGRFLSTVQIGITLIGIVAGAYSGTVFGDALSDRFMAAGLAEHIADPLGYGLVIAAITYLSLVIGELVPKQIALRNAEAIACTVAPVMTTISKIASPVVSVLDASTKAIFRLLRLPLESEQSVTEEEIKTLIAEAETGVLEKDEQRMLVGVMRLADRPVKGVMTPRTEVAWLNIAASEQDVRRILIETAHSLIPVAEGTVDTMIGVVQARALLASVLRGEPLDVRAHIKKALIIPDTMDALDAMTSLRDADVKMALVHDEYGHFEGLVTPADILETLTGMAADVEQLDPKSVLRQDGSHILSGWMPADEMSDLLKIPLHAQRDYQTVAGFVLSVMQRLPRIGEKCEAGGWEFEVLDLDGRRIDKVLATRLGKAS